MQDNAISQNNVDHMSGIVHSQVLSLGQKINHQVYAEILQRMLRDKVWELCQDKSWLLHHDNALVDNVQRNQLFLSERNIAALE